MNSMNWTYDSNNDFYLVGYVIFIFLYYLYLLSHVYVRQTVCCIFLWRMLQIWSWHKFNCNPYYCITEYEINISETIHYIILNPNSLTVFLKQNYFWSLNFLKKPSVGYFDLTKFDYKLIINVQMKWSLWRYKREILVQKLFVRSYLRCRFIHNLDCYFIKKYKSKYCRHSKVDAPVFIMENFVILLFSKRS